MTRGFFDRYRGRRFVIARTGERAVYMMCIALIVIGLIDRARDLL